MEYPQFIPWCSDAVIVRRESDRVFDAELTIRFKRVCERYTSRVTLMPPEEGKEGGASVLAKAIRGPFQFLTNRWELTPCGDGRTKVEFFLEFKLHSSVLGKILKMFFVPASEKMIDAFTRRAYALYDPAHPKD